MGRRCGAAFPQDRPAPRRSQADTRGSTEARRPNSSLFDRDGWPHAPPATRPRRAIGDSKRFFLSVGEPLSVPSPGPHPRCSFSDGGDDWPAGLAVTADFTHYPTMVGLFLCLIGAPRSALRTRADLALSRLWSRWADVLVIVKPDTVVRWHRTGFRLFWRWKSRPRSPARDEVSPETKARPITTNPEPICLCARTRQSREASSRRPWARSWSCRKWAASITATSAARPDRHKVSAMATSTGMAIPLPAGGNRVCSDDDPAPDVGVRACEHALTLADPPRIDHPSAPGSQVGEGQVDEALLSQPLREIHGPLPRPIAKLGHFSVPDRRSSQD